MPILRPSGRTYCRQILPARYLDVAPVYTKRRQTQYKDQLPPPPVPTTLSAVAEEPLSWIHYMTRTNISVSLRHPLVRSRTFPHVPVPFSLFPF